MLDPAQDMTEQRYSLSHRKFHIYESWIFVSIIHYAKTMGVILLCVFPTEEHFFLVILSLHSKVCIPRNIHFQSLERATATVMFA